MRVEFAPFSFADLTDFVVQPRHEKTLEAIKAAGTAAQKVMEGPFSWTGWSAYGQPLGCIGILPNGNTWALLAPVLKQEMLAFSRKATQVMNSFPGEVFAEIDEDHPEAVRWARLLGFEKNPQEAAWRFLRDAG